jgi:hypothetical protein
LHDDEVVDDGLVQIDDIRDELEVELVVEMVQPTHDGHHMHIDYDELKLDEVRIYEFQLEDDDKGEILQHELFDYDEKLQVQVLDEVEGDEVGMVDDEVL